MIAVRTQPTLNWARRGTRAAGQIAPSTGQRPRIPFMIERSAADWRSLKYLLIPSRWPAERQNRAEPLAHLGARAGGKVAARAGEYAARERRPISGRSVARLRPAFTRSARANSPAQPHGHSKPRRPQLRSGAIVATPTAARSVCVCVCEPAPSANRCYCKPYCASEQRLPRPASGGLVLEASLGTPSSSAQTLRAPEMVFTSAH